MSSYRPDPAATAAPQPKADPLPDSVAQVACVVRRGTDHTHDTRGVPEETPVAFSYNGSCYAVMMATPSDLADFALGFSLTSGIVGQHSDIESLAIVRHDEGVELRMWLAPAPAAALAQRRRRLTGPTGCGLCGVETLADALPPVRRVPEGTTISARSITAALPLLVAEQALHRETGAMHAAGFFVPGKGMVSVREDVGRHNALDKLIGDLIRRGIAGADGFVVLTSRVSVEMVQKAAVLGTCAIVAVSAPTALAIRVAEQAGITLVAGARGDVFDTFSGAFRIVP